MLPMGVALIITLGPVGIFMAVLLAGVGALDIWADFRKLNEKAEG
jgi:threonine dehydrogenase-like Zn-dependent dehydrogenase